jgi:hypothetical protein
MQISQTPIFITNTQCARAGTKAGIISREGAKPPRKETFPNFAPLRLCERHSEFLFDLPPGIFVSFVVSHPVVDFPALRARPMRYSFS